MKKFLPLTLLFVSLFFYGCSKHQYVFVEGRQESLVTNAFVIENDSLKIRYDFSGENIPVKIRVENKSDKPVYIDWKKSAAIIEGKKYNYWNETANFEFSGYSGEVYLSASGEIAKDERITYIPANSYVETTRIILQDAFFQNLAKNNVQKVKMLSENSHVQVKRYSFSADDSPPADDSPLAFRSILAFSLQESFTEESFFDDTFWVSEILESKSRNLVPTQKNMADGINSTYNASVLSEKTEFGRAAGTVGLVGITAGLLLLSAGGN